MTELLLETTKKSLQFRYSILKYYYSLFLSANGEGTIFKPLFFVFYEDEILLEESIIDSQFMIGEDLMVAPIIQELFWDRMKEYFPKGDWFDLRDYTKVIKDPTKGSIVTVEGRLKEMPPVFLRAGKTIPIQNADKVYTTDELDNNFNLVIALSHDKNDSLGFIPALKSYNSKSKSNICLGGACFIEIKSEFNPASKELDVVITPPKKVAEDKVVIQIKKFRIMNIDTSLYKFKESSIDSLINGGFLKDEARITVNVINKYVLDIVIEGTFIIDLEKTQSFKVNFE